MRERSLFLYCFWLVLAAFAFGEARAQMGFTLDVKKPEPYDNRVLKAEKTPTDKKIKLPKKVAGWNNRLYAPLWPFR